MKRTTRSLALAILGVLIAAAPARLCAQSTDGAGIANLSPGDVCQIIGGTVALGFGIWHFAVPDLYRWQSYVPDAPQTLVDAVAATNFFMSLTLSMVGATNVAMPLLMDAATPMGRAWLWANVGLWTVRTAYQLVKPQGSHSPALRWGMTAAFVATDLLFVAAAIDATW